MGYTARYKLSSGAIQVNHMCAAKTLHTVEKWDTCTKYMCAVPQERTRHITCSSRISDAKRWIKQEKIHNRPRGTWLLPYVYNIATKFKMTNIINKLEQRRGIVVRRYFRTRNAIVLFSRPTTLDGSVVRCCWFFNLLLCLQCTIYITQCITALKKSADTYIYLHS